MFAAVIITLFIAALIVGCTWIVAVNLGYSRGYRDAEDKVAHRTEHLRRERP